MARVECHRNGPRGAVRWVAMGSRHSEAAKGATEEQLVKGIEPALMRHGLVDSLGKLKRHDAAKGCLRVDFMYADAKPRALAVEVSSIVDESYMAAAKGADRLVGELQKVVKGERLGSWLVATFGERPAKGMKAEILGLMRCGVSVSIDDPYERPFFRPGTKDGAAAEYERLRDRLVKAGVVCVWKYRSAPAEQHDVKLLGTSELLRVTGFSEALQDRISDNDDKFEEARPSSTHLVVAVNTVWADRDPAQTPVPTLPASIDALWVVQEVDKEGRAHGWWTGKPKADAWSEIWPGDFDDERVRYLT